MAEKPKLLRKTHIVSVRLAEREYATLKMLTDYFRKTPSEILRTALNSFWYTNSDLISREKH